MSELIEHHVKPSGEFYVLRGEVGTDVLWGVLYSSTPGAEAFLEDFELDREDYLGDPTEDHYQGTTFTRLITRKRDGAVFGSPFWYNPGIDSIEGQATGPDAESLGVVVDWENDEEDPVVFLPVRKFERVGYEVIKP